MTQNLKKSKMIKKNSGGEGQNPLYVALLASFAQAYHINLSPKLSRRPTIRLVVLPAALPGMLTGAILGLGATQIADIAVVEHRL